MRMIILGAVLATAISAPSFADNLMGPYAGGGFGRFDLKIENLNDVGQAVNSIAHSNDTSWKVFAGWRLIPFLSVEAAYVNLGNQKDRFSATGSDGSYRVKMDGFSPSLIGSVPLGPVDIFAKAGYYFYNVDLRTQLDSPGTNFINSSHSRSDFVYGGGLGMTFLDHLNVRAEYEKFRLGNYGDSNALWLDAAWRF